MLFMKYSPTLISKNTKTVESNVKNFHPILKIDGLIFNFQVIKNISQNHPFCDGLEALV